MIVTGLSSAQLDTIDDMGWAFELADAIDKFAEMLGVSRDHVVWFNPNATYRLTPPIDAQRFIAAMTSGIAMMSESVGRMGHVLERIDLRTFDLPRMMKDAKPVPNARAPIPDRLRRRADRKRGW